MPDPLETLHLGLPYLAPAQAQKHVTHNEALRRLDEIVQLAVLDASLTDAPADPTEGDRHIVATGATGGWAGKDGNVAAFIDGAWAFFDAVPGWIAYDVATESVLVRQDDGWTTIGSFLGPITRLGVNTDADDTNRLAVRSNALLFSPIVAADGGNGDVRFIVDKETDTDTASLLFQSGFSGRAEVGLAGDTDLVFKVSPDGSAWTEAIRLDKDTGLATILYDNGASGLAATTVQDAIDEVAAAAGGGAVSSVFGRTGSISAALHDYDASQVDNDSAVAGATVKDALDALQTADAARIPSTYLDTDGTLAANSDARIATQKAVKTYVDGLAVNLGKRARVRAATTANIAISTALNNGDTLDGVTLVAGDLVLVKNQSSAQDNGIYAVGVSPARDAQFDTYDEHPGSLIAIEEGTANADTLWLCTSNDGGTLNTTAIGFSKMVIAGELLAGNNLSDLADAATAFGVIKQTATIAATGVVQLGSQVRERLSATRTYYVRTDGSDANNGLANSSGGAFLTIQKAIDTVAALDISIYDVTIQVGNGTYTGACVLKTILGSGQVTILGDATTPANVLVSTTANDCFLAQDVVGRWKLKGMKLTSATSGYLLSISGVVTTVEFENLNFGASPAISIYVSAGCSLKATGAFTISGGTSTFIYNNNANLVMSNITVTLTGTPAFSPGGFCNVINLGFTQFYSVTFSGAATGTRYSVAGNSLINTFGAGASALPGNAAGSTASGGQYL